MSRIPLRGGVNGRQLWAEHEQREHAYPEAEKARWEFSDQIVACLGELTAKAEAANIERAVSVWRPMSFREMVRAKLATNGLDAFNQPTICEAGRFYGWEISDVIRPAKRGPETPRLGNIMLLETGNFAFEGCYPTQPASDNLWYVPEENFLPIRNTLCIDHIKIYTGLTGMLHNIDQCWQPPKP